jgi:signal transduction histidine kinase
MAVMHHSAKVQSFAAHLGYSQAATISTARGTGFIFAWEYGYSTQRSIGAIRRGVLIAVPLLLLIWAVAIYVGLGFALAPVETIRRRVASIAGRDLRERVPVSGTNDEISRLATTLNSMLARLEEASRFQQEFISNASHELRSPLATLLATVDQARARGDAASWPAVADTVVREGRRLNAIIDDLFWLARSDEDGVSLNRQEIDLDDILLEEARRVADLTQLRVDTSAVAPARLWGDEAMLRRLFRNIVDNGARYAFSTLTMSTRYDGAYVEVTAHNDGVTLDPDEAEKFFARFAREDKSRARASGGTGLGLTIVRDIAERHGGTAVFAPVASGTAVQVRLPRY